MRRIENPMREMMHGIATYEISPGRYVDVSILDVQQHGLEAVLKSMGIKPASKEPVNVRQFDRIIGTVPWDFEPLAIRSLSPLYVPRGGDFKFENNEWIADKMLGPGDLEAIPGFVWKRP